VFDIVKDYVGCIIFMYRVQ